MDLISFEDLVVQPYNSYFSLEKELQEVKSQLSLMEQRLKYLEDKKPKKKTHVKQEDTYLKEYEIEKKIQNDADRKLRLINRNKIYEEEEHYNQYYEQAEQEENKTIERQIIISECLKKTVEDCLKHNSVTLTEKNTIGTRELRHVTKQLKKLQYH